MFKIRKNPNLQHIGEYLYADGKRWTFIGRTPRTPEQLRAIYLKYLRSSEG